MVRARIGLGCEIAVDVDPTEANFFCTESKEEVSDMSLVNMIEGRAVANCLILIDLKHLYMLISKFRLKKLKVRASRAENVTRPTGLARRGV